MEFLKLLVVFAMSIAISKFTGYVLMMLFFFVKRKEEENLFKDENRHKIITATKTIYAISAFISTSAAFGMLKFLNYSYALVIALIMFAIRFVIIFAKYKKEGDKYIIEKLSQKQ